MNVCYVIYKIPGTVAHYIQFETRRRQLNEYDAERSFFDEISLIMFRHLTCLILLGTYIKTVRLISVFSCPSSYYKETSGTSI